MKIGQTTKIEDGRIILKKTFSATPALEAARALRDAGKADQGESKVIGVVPVGMWFLWAKKYGVDPTDSAAMRDVVDREMMNSDNANLRVWKGSY